MIPLCRFRPNYPIDVFNVSGGGGNSILTSVIGAHYADLEVRDVYVGNRLISFGELGITPEATPAGWSICAVVTSGMTSAPT